MRQNPQKIFTTRKISIVTFFGGPLAAGFLISRNFKAFGNEVAARNSIIIGILSTIIIFAVFFAFGIPQEGYEKRTRINAEYSGTIPEEFFYLNQYQINDYRRIFYNSSMPLSEVKIGEGALIRLKSYIP